MKLRIDQVDAFASELFTGNPAAVVVTEQMLDASLMQNIAMENNLAETAFVSGSPEMYDLRWFTPTVEVDLCGHATLAAAHVLFKNYINADRVSFNSQSGPLAVYKKDGLLWLDFPADEVVEADESTDALEDALGCSIKAVYRGRTDLMILLENETMLRELKPNITKIERFDYRGVIVTAPGNEVDLVSRFFAPQSGVPEDPVTGSAHTTLAPFWSKQLGKEALEAKQLSKRGGSLKCHVKNDRVHIGGNTITYLTGEINV